MKLLGNWTGVTYFERIHDYIPDTPLILCIETIDEDGNVKGRITEIILDEKEAKRVQEYTRKTFPVVGYIERESGKLYLKEVILSGTDKDSFTEGNLQIIAEVDYEKEEIEGRFYDLRWKECVQVLELSKCHAAKNGCWLNLKTSPLIDAIAEEMGDYTD
ncbi:hypothetical protein [Sinanaerobacter sp. ZZT-01]|uniref:hypothetical protein n=1 Tax=Sinanaerobacter sp. ZZT-01 TaxID=3111540 RepID=UPI002D76D683|nr:hypothetical protein [Sinanaerobacter sp. ZZT-01]WRR94450.1 hypothetical protein U5921_04855 [Sinanaerobacter sp. ZZT-01]